VSLSFVERSLEVLPMAVRDDEHGVRAERARKIGLFRYQLVREAADAALSAKALAESAEQSAPAALGGLRLPGQADPARLPRSRPRCAFFPGHLARHGEELLAGTFVGAPVRPLARQCAGS
jgi:hypothetical protein